MYLSKSRCLKKSVKGKESSSILHNTRKNGKKMIFSRKKYEVERIIDEKQQFSDVAENTNKIQFLYEVDFKTRYSAESLEMRSYLQSLTLFEDSTYRSKKIAYKIHYTQIPLYEIAIDLSGWNVFKLTIALSRKISLRVVIHNLLINIGKSEIKILRSRIVTNKKKVAADVYFNELNEYLQENHPDHKVLIIHQKNNDR